MLGLANKYTNGPHSPHSPHGPIIIWNKYERSPWSHYCMEQMANHLYPPIIINITLIMNPYDVTNLVKSIRVLIDY